VAQHHAQGEPLMRAHPPLEGLLEGNPLGPHASAGEGGKDARILLAAISARRMARPETPATSEATEASLIFARSRTFWTRLTSDARSRMSAERMSAER
jgi:hypothetical protein